MNIYCLKYVSIGLIIVHMFWCFFWALLIEYEFLLDQGSVGGIEGPWQPRAHKKWPSEFECPRCLLVNSCTTPLTFPLRLHMQHAFFVSSSTLMTSPQPEKWWNLLSLGSSFGLKAGQGFENSTLAMQLLQQVSVENLEQLWLQKIRQLHTTTACLAHLWAIFGHDAVLFPTVRRSVSCIWRWASRLALPWACGSGAPSPGGGSTCGAPLVQSSWRAQLLASWMVSGWMPLYSSIYLCMLKDVK